MIQHDGCDDFNIIHKHDYSDDFSMIQHNGSNGSIMIQHDGSDDSMSIPLDDILRSTKRKIPTPAYVTDTASPTLLTHLNRSGGQCLPRSHNEGRTI